MPPLPIHTLSEARAAMAGARTWIVTDGKAGDLAQCLGIAERLDLSPERRTVRPRAPWSWLMPLTWRLPWLSIDPAEAPGRAGGPLPPPLPDLVIASGRRAAAYLPAIKRASGGRSFTVFLKDPRVSPSIADFIWVPEHDSLRAPNVMVTALSPHRLPPEALAAARMAAPAEIRALRAPRIAVLVGGDSRDFRFSDGDIRRFSDNLATLAATGASLMATPSRRTPPALAARMREIIATAGGWFWDGTGDNPFHAFLAHADALVVTADSVNMIGEAAATGKPVMIFRPTGGSRKIDGFLKGLEARGVTRPFSGCLETYTYEPIDDTPAIVIDIARRYTEFRQPEMRT